MYLFRSQGKSQQNGKGNGVNKEVSRPTTTQGQGQGQGQVQGAAKGTSPFSPQGSLTRSTGTTTTTTTTRTTPDSPPTQQQRPPTQQTRAQSQSQPRSLPPSVTVAPAPVSPITVDTRGDSLSRGPATTHPTRTRDTSYTPYTMMQNTSYPPSHPTPAPAPDRHASPYPQETCAGSDSGEEVVVGEVTVFPMGFPAGSEGLQVVWDVLPAPVTGVNGVDSGWNDGGGWSGGWNGGWSGSGGMGGGVGSSSSTRSLSSAKLYQSQPFALAGRWWNLR